MGQVSVIIRRRVQPGKEAAFEQALTEMYDFCARNVHGSVGASFVRPPKGSKTNEYTVSGWHWQSHLIGTIPCQTVGPGSRFW
jgi:antibiotic biosynthesis monooxygenase (ABM) superfamily enzyme